MSIPCKEHQTAFVKHCQCHLILWLGKVMWWVIGREAAEGASSFVNQSESFCAIGYYLASLLGLLSL